MKTGGTAGVEILLTADEMITCRCDIWRRHRRQEGRGKYMGSSMG